MTYHPIRIESEIHKKLFVYFAGVTTNLLLVISSGNQMLGNLVCEGATNVWQPKSWYR